MPDTTDSVTVTLPMASASLIEMPLSTLLVPSVAVNEVGSVLLASSTSVMLMVAVLVAVSCGLVPWSWVAMVSVSVR